MDVLRVLSLRGVLFDGLIWVFSLGGFDSFRRELSLGVRGFGGLLSFGWSFDRNGSGYDDYKNVFGVFDFFKLNVFGFLKNVFGFFRYFFGFFKNVFGFLRDFKNLLFFGNLSFDVILFLFGGSLGGFRRDDFY